MVGRACELQDSTSVDRTSDSSSSLGKPVEKNVTIHVKPLVPVDFVGIHFDRVLFAVSIYKRSFCSIRL